jgi:hypothetical protein
MVGLCLITYLAAALCDLICATWKARFDASRCDTGSHTICASGRLLAA